MIIKQKKELLDKKSLIKRPNMYVIFKYIEFKKSNSNEYKKLVKLTNGINYETNRKIKINGKLYNELKQSFYILDKCNNNKKYYLNILCEIEMKYGNFKKYISDVEHKNNIINIENILIKQHNDYLTKYYNVQPKETRGGYSSSCRLKYQCSSFNRNQNLWRD